MSEVLITWIQNDLHIFGLRLEGVSDCFADIAPDTRTQARLHCTGNGRALNRSAGGAQAPPTGHRLGAERP